MFCLWLQENCLNSEVVEQIYKRNPILRYSHHPLHSPLLPLPYGDIHLTSELHRYRHKVEGQNISIYSSSLFKPKLQYEQG